MNQAAIDKMLEIGKKGGILGLAAVVVYVLMQVFGPYFEDQNANRTEQTDRVVSAIENFTHESGEAQREIADSLGELSVSLKDLAAEVVDLDKRVNVIEEGRLPALDFRLRSIEERKQQ